MKTSCLIIVVLSLVASSSRAAVLQVNYARTEYQVFSGSLTYDEELMDYVPGPRARRVIDVDQNGVVDFEFVADDPATIDLQTLATNRITGYGYPEGSQSLGMWATPVFPGESIGAMLPSGVTWHADLYGATISSAVGGGLGELPDPRLLYFENTVGLEFLREGAIHYGYVRFYSRVLLLDVLEVAWETEPGVPILIPAPEPGAPLLLTAALVAAASLRRRRTT